MLKKSLVVSRKCVIGILIIALSMVVGCSNNARNAVSTVETTLKNYNYSNGQVMRQDFLDATGQIERSRWFRPDGHILGESKFENGTGIELYLSTDGTIRALVPCRNGKADGTAIYFHRDLSMAEIIEYKDGIKLNTLSLFGKDKDN